ncbi:MAG: hypothetical protein K0S56_4110 [Microvirga sp.]|jgi:hypothetical protein|nr:hypothetical protein [Microvirga sp.]
MTRYQTTPKVEGTRRTRISALSPSFEDLPLFATDLEIGAAVVGGAKADHWAKVTVKGLERQAGFPRFDEVHQGRYTPGVRKFYEHLHGAPAGQLPMAQETPEDHGSWTSRTPRRLG